MSVSTGSVDFNLLSSEEFQRHKSVDVFSAGEARKRVDPTEKEKVRRVLDKYIAVHSSTKGVRSLAKENQNVEKYGAEYQLDLSADIVEILEKIKSDLR